MTEKNGPGQQSKAQAEAKTAQVGADANNPEGTVPDEAKAENNVADGDQTVNPYPNYDFMTVEALQSLADERGVEVNRDVLKAHLITELRAADSGTPSAVTRRGAR